jgi:ABC-type transport system involved in multi-copper enzyme maturation permease subunit
MWTNIRNTAMLEPEQMTLTFAAGGMRMILAIGLIVFVCFHIRHAFESREIDVLLSRPISRSHVVLSYWLGFALITTLLAIPAMVILWLLGLIDVTGYAYWSLSLLLELWLVVAISLFAAFTLPSAVAAVLASMGFYVLSRMMGFFLSTAENGVLFDDPTVNEVLKNVILFISVFIPRLDFFGKSTWLVYETDYLQYVWLYVKQTVIFIPFLLVLTMIDFRRKEF